MATPTSCETGALYGVIDAAGALEEVASCLAGVASEATMGDGSIIAVLTDAVSMARMAAELRVWAKAHWQWDPNRLPNGEPK